MDEQFGKFVRTKREREMKKQWDAMTSLPIMK